MADDKPTLSVLSPLSLEMPKGVQQIKTYAKTWDSDKALKSTDKRVLGKYQLRAYLFLLLGYTVVAAWLTAMPTFALLPPRDIDCLRYQTETNGTSKVNYEYGRSVLTDFNALCNKTLLKIPHVVFLIGLILGGLILGFLADHNGRKMVLLGSLWVTCVMSIFQLLSEDYISYAFFMLFIGITIGGVQVITLPYVMEMFPSDTRAIYGLVMLGSVFLLDLAIPWLAIGLKHWKILQAVVSIPLIFTAALYWFSEESMFWYIAQKDHVTAILSLSKIAQFNGVTFETVFSDARSFLSKKSSKATQCDFQPLLRLEDVKTLGAKYPDFDMVDLENMNSKKNSVTQRFLQTITGRHLQANVSAFYPTDFFHSSILTAYLLIMCGLWFVSALTEYSLDSSQLTDHLTGHFLRDYFFTHLIQLISFVVAFPMIYRWGRRWPTFFFFLIAEVCLLGSVAVKLDNDRTRTGMLIVYFIGKLATRAAFLVIFIYTCEIFPTGLRCTAVGICYTCRWIGIILASPHVGGVNDWMSRLIYGILALILGSLALLLPETKKTIFPRTLKQSEDVPSSISETFRRRRIQRKAKLDGAGPRTSIHPSDTAPVLRANRPYDHQSTLHSVYELQEFAPDDPTGALTYRYASRRADHPRSPILSSSHFDFSRQQSIAEADEERNSERKGLSVPAQITSDQLSMAVGDALKDEGEMPVPDDLLSRSPRYRRTISEDENYFSEHC